jgi:replicative DNA helicase
MFDEEIEKVVLYYIIFDNADNPIIEEDFVYDRNKKIATAIIELRKEKKEISMISVKGKIKANQKQVLGYISNIGNNIYGTSLDEAYIKLKNLTKKRKMYNLAHEILQNIENEDADIYSQKIIKELNEITNESDKEEKLIDQISTAVMRIEDNWRNRNDYSLYTGILDLDNKLCGLHNQELTIIGARPGVGKTTLALQIAQKIANNDRNVLFISLEMSEIQLIQKMIAKEGNINSYKMRMGTLEDKDFETITKVATNLSQMKFNINTRIRNIQQIELKCRKLKNQGKLDLVIIDYIQLLKSNEKFNIREQEVADISRRLKLLSLELDIPIIALCQLNRNASTGEPTLADLRESGSLEQDADNIWFLYQGNQQDTNLITINVAKQRAGETGSVKVKFNKNTSQFINLASGV